MSVFDRYILSLANMPFKNLGAMYFFSCSSFCLVLVLTIFRVLNLEGELGTKAAHLIPYLFSIFVAFILATVLQQRQERQRLN